MRSLTQVQRLSLLLLVVTGVLNYLDRSALSVTNAAIRQDMGLSLGHMGLLLSAFSWSYALAQLPIGGLIDRYRPRLMLTFGIVFWSVAQALCGRVNSLASFLGARILLGIGESPQFPTAARVVSDWFPLEKRGFPTGVFNSASPLGTAIAPPVLSLMLVTWGWRAVFVALGIAGLFVAVLWWSAYRNPDQVRLSDEARAVIARPEPAPKASGGLKTWGRLFRHGTTWGMIFGFFGSVYLNWLYLTWLPNYLQMARGMDTIHSGFAAFVPFFCGFIGCLVAGGLSDRLVRLTGSTVKGRKYLTIGAMFGMAAFTVPAALVHSNLLALICISAVIFLANVASTGSWALVSAVAPPQQVASLGAVQNFGGYIGGALAPVVTGYIVQWTGSFVPALLVGAAAASLSALVYLFGVRKPIVPSAEIQS
ncbi:MFS transporter [Asticcacaulis solisilvae]|uniref:MFS transporter n=1 Tax=Asticcacaulis solisilvae TaxID=1217274 RepID=UPI003FD7D567